MDKTLKHFTIPCLMPLDQLIRSDPTIEIRFNFTNIADIHEARDNHTETKPKLKGILDTKKHSRRKSGLESEHNRSVRFSEPEKKQTTRYVRTTRGTPTSLRQSLLKPASASSSSSEVKNLKPSASKKQPTESNDRLIRSRSAKDQPQSEPEVISADDQSVHEDKPGTSSSKQTVGNNLKKKHNWATERSSKLSNIASIVNMNLKEDIFEAFVDPKILYDPQEIADIMGLTKCPENLEALCCDFQIMITKSDNLTEFVS